MGLHISRHLFGDIGPVISVTIDAMDFKSNPRTVSLMESEFLGLLASAGIIGAQTVAEATERVRCPECGGVGDDPASNRNPCPECGGLGEVLRAVGEHVSFPLKTAAGNVMHARGDPQMSDKTREALAVMTDLLYAQVRADPGGLDVVSPAGELSQLHMAGPAALLPNDPVPFGAWWVVAGAAQAQALPAELYDALFKLGASAFAAGARAATGGVR